MKRLKNKKMLAAAVVIVVLAVAGLVYTNLYLRPSKEDLLKAGQITQISSLDTGAILRLYKATGDWDTLITNIAVYQEILGLVEGTSAEKQFYRLIPKYGAADLYVAFDYFTDNRLPADRITEILDQRAEGGDWDSIIANCGIPPEYANYRVLEKDELHQLLARGFLPEDIIKADEIARSKDLPLQDVLRLKTGENTWDDVSVSLGRPAESRRRMNLSVPGTDRIVEDPEALTLVSSQKVEEHEQDVKTSIKAELGLTDEQIKTHLSQGFNLWEVRNAYKLAQAGGVSAQEILDRIKAGLGWEEILAAYPEK